MLARKILGIWLAILVAAIANGALREAVLMRYLPHAVALVASGLLLAIIVVAIAWALVPRLGALSASQRLAIGIAWLLLTLAFEFAFGRLVQGRRWDELLAAYTFAGGNVWPAVLVAIVLAPFAPLLRR